MSYISAITKDADVIVWERDEAGRKEVEYDAPFYFYIKDPKGKHKTIYGDTVSKETFSTSQQMRKAKDNMISSGKEVFETDIPPEIRVLSNAYYGKPAPKLHVSFYDIEVDYDPEIGFASVKNPYAPINSIAIVHQWSNQLIVLTVPPTDEWDQETLTAAVKVACPEAPIPDEYEMDIIVCENEKHLLLTFLVEIEDSDLICGWNSDWFDAPYIGKRIKQVLGEKMLAKLSFDRARAPTFREVEVMGNIQETIDLHGRMSADYMVLYRKYEPGERASYKLEAIEQEVGLNLPKIKYEGSLSKLYKKNYPFFVRYNIRDTEILHGFEKKLAYVELANQMYHLSTGLFKHVSGTLKLAELAIVNYCHHVLKQVVPDAKEPAEDKSIEGALVLDPKIGMHDWVGSVDINSLYPSSIRSINISPETIIGQFSENVAAAEEIAAGGFKNLTLVFETKESCIKPAYEWKEHLKEHRWAISGYGTVFDQNKQGIIPTVLADWYAMRKKYQAMKKEAEANMMDITNKYKKKGK